LGFAEQTVNGLRIPHDRQNAVLEAVVEDAIGKAGGNDDAAAVVIQRPGRMLAARATPETLPRQQYRGSLVARLVHDESLVQRPIAVVTPRLALVQITMLVEQVHAEAAALDGFQELLGNDEIRINIGPVQRHDQAALYCEFFHLKLSIYIRFSRL